MMTYRPAFVVVSIIVCIALGLSLAALPMTGALAIGFVVLGFCALGLCALRRYEREAGAAESLMMRRRQQLGRPGWRRRR